jgi:glutathione synthase/RimK-type ligase-like ATP-grasp enzyme
LSSDAQVSRSYWLDGSEIDLDSVTSVLWRRPAKAEAAPAFVDKSITRYVETSSEEVLQGLFDDLDCFQVPARRSVLVRGYAKIPQLTLAAKLGFELPVTLVTNDPGEFLDFYRLHKGKVITKTASVQAESWLGPMGTGYARLVHPRDLVHFHDVQLCPLIAQVYVEKALEIRVTVVGNEVFAAGIHSQATRRTRVDWRRYDRANTPHDVHALPAEIAQLCLSLVRAMDLAYGTIDLILTREGRYVFLEINPNGQYKWIESLTGLPITKRIVRLLVEHA